MFGVWCIISMLYDEYVLLNKLLCVLIFVKFVNKEILELVINGLFWKIEYMGISICMYIFNIFYWLYIYDIWNVVNIEIICLLLIV